MYLLNRISNKLRIEFRKFKLNQSGNIIRGVVDLESQFQGKNKVEKGSVIIKSKIGYATYIGSNSRVLYADIKRYCSIGRNLDIVFGNHPLYNCISTHPAFYSPSNFPNGYSSTEKFPLFKLRENNVAVEIGNDVWVGDNVVIMGGVKISDGAVIATSAVVTKDIPPYAIVGGVPAHVIGYRFSDEIIKSLLQIKWWNKSEEWIINHADEFFCENKENIDAVVKKFLQQENKY